MLRLHPTSFGSSYEEEAEWPLTRFAERIEGQAIFVAEDGGEAVGVAALVPETMRKFRHKATLGCMYVRETARGHGVAAALVEAVLEEARARGIEQVKLTVSAGNPAERLYARLGFEVYGQEPRALRHNGRDYDEVQMVRRI